MSTYRMDHTSHAYGVREVESNLLVFAAADASATSAAYLVAFLNSHARHVPAERVRTLLVELGSDLRSVEPGRTEQPERHERSA